MAIWQLPASCERSGTIDSKRNHLVLIDLDDNEKNTIFPEDDNDVAGNLPLGLCPTWWNGEIGQLEKIGTWVIEDLPKGHTVIPCREVLREKQGPTGDIEYYQIRIVAGGHKQIEWVNYTETFSTAAKMPSVYIVLENAAT